MKEVGSWEGFRGQDVNTRWIGMAKQEAATGGGELPDGKSYTPQFRSMVGLGGQEVAQPKDLLGGRNSPVSEPSQPLTPDLLIRRGEVLTRIQKRVFEVGGRTPSSEDISFPTVSIQPGYKDITAFFLEKVGLQPNQISVILVESKGRKRVDTVSFLASKGQDLDKPGLYFAWTDEAETESLILNYEGVRYPPMFRSTSRETVFLGGSDPNSDHVLLLTRVTDGNRGIGWIASSVVLPKDRQSVVKDHKLIEEAAEQPLVPAVPIKAKAEGGEAVGRGPTGTMEAVAAKKEPAPTPDQKLRDQVVADIKFKVVNVLKWRENGELNMQDVSVPKIAVDTGGVLRADRILQKMGLNPENPLSIIIIGDKENEINGDNKLVVSAREHAFSYSTRKELFLQLRLKSLRDISEISLKCWRMGSPCYFTNDLNRGNEILLGRHNGAGETAALLIDARSPLSKISSVFLPDGWRGAFDKDGKLIEEPRVLAEAGKKMEGEKPAQQAAQAEKKPASGIPLGNKALIEGMKALEEHNHGAPGGIIYARYLEKKSTQQRGGRHSRRK